MARKPKQPETPEAPGPVQEAHERMEKFYKGRKANLAGGSMKAQVPFGETPPPDVEDEDEDSHVVSKIGMGMWKVALTPQKMTKRKYDDPEELAQRCSEYFQWADSNPIREVKLFVVGGKVKKVTAPKPRAYTIEGLCVFLGLSRDAWNEMSKGNWVVPVQPGLPEVIQTVNKIIKEQKFVGAAVDVFNAGFIAKDLGLTEKQELSGPEGGPVQVTTTTRETLAAKLNRIAAADRSEDGV